MQKGSHVWTWSRSAVVSCGIRLIYNGLFQSGNVFYGQTSPNFTFLLEIPDAMSSGLKRRETFQHVISIQFKSQHLWWYGGALYGMGSLHVLEGTMKRYVKVLEQHMLPSRQRLFQQDNAKPQTAIITTAWLHKRRDLPAVQIFLL